MLSLIMNIPLRLNLTNTIMRYLFIIKFYSFVLFQEVIVFNNKVIAEQFELKNFKEF